MQGGRSGGLHMNRAPKSRCRRSVLGSFLVGISRSCRPETGFCNSPFLQPEIPCPLPSASRPPPSSSPAPPCPPCRRPLAHAHCTTRQRLRTLDRLYARRYSPRMDTSLDSNHVSLLRDHMHRTAPLLQSFLAAAPVPVLFPRPPGLAWPGLSVLHNTRRLC